MDSPAAGVTSARAMRLFVKILWPLVHVRTAIFRFLRQFLLADSIIRCSSDYETRVPCISYRALCMSETWIANLLRCVFTPVSHWPKCRFLPLSEHCYPLLGRMAMVDVDGRELLRIFGALTWFTGLWGWRPPGAQSTFIKWTGWTLAMTLVMMIAP